MRQLVAALAALLCLVGCASFSGQLDPSTAEVQIVGILVKNRAANYFEKHPADAARAVVVIDSVLEAASGDAPIDLAKLREVAEKQIRWDRLSLSDQLAVRDILDIVEAALEERANAAAGQLPRAELSLVLGWVREAASFVAAAESRAES